MASLVCRSGWYNVTYNLAIEVVLFDHDSVHTFRIPEGKEAEPARAASRGVAHDGALADLAKLGKVVLERVYGNISTVAMIEVHGVKYAQEAHVKVSIPSVVSQFKPPINILLVHC